MPETSQSGGTIPETSARPFPLKRKIAFAILFLVVVVALAIFLVESSADLKPLPLKYLGTRTGPAGEKMAEFSFRNTLSGQISYGIWLEEKQGATWPQEGYLSSRTNWNIVSYMHVQENENGTFGVSVPTNGVPWRVWILYTRYPTPLEEAFENVGSWFRKRGFNGIGTAFEARGQQYYIFHSPEMPP